VTAPQPKPDRDELADLIYRTIEGDPSPWMTTVDGTGNVVCHVAADAILAAWVKPTSCNCDCGSCWHCDENPRY
jgi:hypothetical protein